ncbi:MAG: hypothetical protein SFV15_20200 [Polyangiaceae bacterium]|nr:hypothetical protein [Polyangiaceae bacterium]
MKTFSVARWVGFLFLVGANAGAAPLIGSDDLATVTQQVLASCAGATGITPTFGTSAQAEAALAQRIQEVAPMTRPLDPAPTCGGPNAKESEGVVFGLDAAVALGAQAEVGSCALAYSRTLAVTDQNGNPGLDCPDCSAGFYQLTDWRDVLRVLLAGMTHGAGSDLASQQCNSDVRHTLANSWASLFQGECGASGCTALRHIFRAEDTAEVSVTLLKLLSLPSPVVDAAGEPISTPFCNGGTYDDNDPVRRPCSDAEGVCGADGTLGLLLPAAPVKNAPASAAYPTMPCSTGVYEWRPAPSSELSSCPGGGLNVFTLCLVPGLTLPDGTVSHQCYKSEANDAPFFTPNSVNTRVFNKYLRNPNGSLVIDNQGREVYGAFYRLHSASALSPSGRLCTEADAQGALGCLPQASQCSLSLARRVATRQAGSHALPINAVSPTDANVRKILQKPVPGDAYPLSSKLLMNTMVGSEEVVSLPQKNLYECFRRQLFAETPVLNAGYVSIQQNGICEDFDERQCGAVFNKNNCKKGINFCPSIGLVTAFPLQVAVGGTVFLSGSASDIDDPFSDLQVAWSAPFGTFADFRSLATTYTCTQVGTAQLKLTIWDGACDDVFSVSVTCVAP